jgi:hypothetical protein
MKNETTMTNFDLKNEIINAWDETVADLTPAERNKLTELTAEQVVRAIVELAFDPDFWAGVGVALIEGLARGIQKHNR